MQEPGTVRWHHNGQRAASGSAFVAGDSVPPRSRDVLESNLTWFVRNIDGGQRDSIRAREPPCTGTWRAMGCGWILARAHLPH
jgi:hypothetical protein